MLCNHPSYCFLRHKLIDWSIDGFPFLRPSTFQQLWLSLSGSRNTLQYKYGWVCNFALQQCALCICSELRPSCPVLESGKPGTKVHSAHAPGWIHPAKSWSLASQGAECTLHMLRAEPIVIQCWSLTNLGAECPLHMLRAEPILPNSRASQPRK